MEPVVTMIVPVRNRVGLLKGVVDSIRAAWERTAFDVVVVDNGSTDNSPEVIARDLLPYAPSGCKALLVEEVRPGASAARNRGIVEATTPYIMFFDSDDLFTPAHMERVDRGARLWNGKADLLTWDVAYTDGARMPRTPEVASLRHHLFHASLSSLRYCASARLIERAGGWNESLPVWNDYEFGVRLLLEMPSAVKLKGEPEVFVRRVADSITGTLISDKARERVMSLDAVSDSLLRAGMERMLPYVDARRMLLAAQCEREGKPGLAEELRRQALDGAAGPWERTVLRGAYLLQRRFGRGGSPLCQALL